jgi:pumilio RNA-binding family
LHAQTSPSSPNFSTASVSSALRAPTDLSSGIPFYVKLHSPYERPYLLSPSILFENGSPVNDQESLALKLQAPAYRAPLVHLNRTRTQPQAGANSHPFFEPFAEPPTPAPVSQNQNHPSPPSNIAQSLYNTPMPRRVDHARLQPVDWRMNNQLHLDWRLASEKFANDTTFGNGHEEPLRSSFIHQQIPSTQLFQPSHEVSIIL